MARKKLREDKTCQNCGAQVDKTFCPECGQKNTDERRLFYKLFTEFFSTMINYDSAFWRTTRDLFLSPGKLSKEYINGKRNLYLKPVQMYLFASFVVFFIPTIMPSDDSIGNDPPIKYDEMDGINLFLNDDDESIQAQSDSIYETIENKSKPRKLFSKYGNVSTRAELDSVYYSWPKEERSFGKHIVAKIAIRVIQNYQQKTSFGDRVFTFAIDNFPKVIFIYMPVFAFLLWLLHSKKKWYYYDSGIFTLHFFALVLLTISILHILSPVFCNLLGWDTIYGFLVTGGILYITFYFYRAHHVFYGENKWISRLKASALIFINFFLMLIVLCVFFLLAVLF